MIGIIDPPGRYAPRAEWQEFLRRMAGLPQDDPQVQAAIEEARRALARRTTPRYISSLADRRKRRQV
jgi:hypothetical protein